MHIDGTPVTTRLVKEIHRAATTPEIREYYIRKYNWTDEVIASVDWEGQTKAMETFTQSKHRTLHKYIHAWLPTGDHMRKRYRGTNKCPHCKELEMAAHLTQCSLEEQSRDIFIDRLAERLQALQTDRGLMQLLLDLLNNRKGTVPRINIENKIWTLQLRYEQTQIGNQKLWSGYLTQTWGDIQEPIYREKNSPAHLTGSKWVKIVIKEIFQYVLSVWQRRNETVHETTGQVSHMREHILAQVRALYGKYSKHTDILLGLYKHNIDTLEKNPLNI